MAFKKLVGDLAQTSVGSSISITNCTTTVGSPTVTTASSLAALTVGLPVSGTGIPAGATVLAVGNGSFTLSVNATVAGSTTVTVGETQVVGLMDWSIDIKLKTPDATTTDDSAWESSLPSSKSWTAKANFCFYDGDPSQQANILATINKPGFVSQWNFFPDAANSDVAFSGLAFIDSISFSAGTGKVVGLNVTLKGTGPLNQVVQIAPIANPNTNTGQQAEV